MLIRTKSNDESLLKPSTEYLVKHEEGAVFVEYVTLLILVSIIGAAAVFALGMPLINRYNVAHGILVLPIP